jgi:hypothetical protein
MKGGGECRDTDRPTVYMYEYFMGSFLENLQCSVVWILLLQTQINLSSSTQPRIRKLVIPLLPRNVAKMWCGRRTRFEGRANIFEQEGAPSHFGNVAQLSLHAKFQYT